MRHVPRQDLEATLASAWLGFFPQAPSSLSDFAAMVSRSRRSLAATAAATALLASCDVPMSADAFNQPLHLGLSPPVAQTPALGGTHLQRSSLLQGRYEYGATATSTTTSCNRGSITRRVSGITSPLQSSFIEEPPANAGSADGSFNRDDGTSLEDANKTAQDAMLGDMQTQAPTGNEKNKLLSKLAEKVGAVDESRIAFPELTTGEVPRMYRYVQRKLNLCLFYLPRFMRFFHSHYNVSMHLSFLFYSPCSNLKYDKSVDGKISASKHASGSTLEATALIAGTTLGVSMLHLPSAVASSGFLYSSAFMFPSYVYSVMSGLLIAELCINRMGTTGKRDVKLMELFRESLGKLPSAIGAVAYFGLQLAVILACIATGGESIGTLLNSIGAGDVLSSFLGAKELIFAGGVGAASLAVKPSAKDTMNNVLLVGTVATLLATLGVGGTTADFSALVAGENQNPKAVFNALPLIFMALGYQQVMPKVTSMLEGDKDKIITSVIAGTAIPFVLFLIWNAITLGNAMAGSGLLASGVDPVALLQSQGGVLGGLISAFSMLVVSGTLFNFSGLFVDNVEDTAQIQNRKWRPALFAGSLVPAALISASDAVNTCKLLDYAGAFSISVLFLFLPSIMIWKARYGEDNSPLSVKPMVPFGKLSLSSLWKVAATLFIEQGAEKLGIIEWLMNFFH